MSTNAEISTIIQLYDSVEKRIRPYLYHLTAIEADHQLMARGWKVNLAVDYYQIYSYAFPLTEFIETFTDRVPSEDDRIELVERQAAISFVFEGLKQVPTPILLPPHAVELRNTIAQKKAGFERRGTQWHKIRAWNDAVLSEENRLALKELLAWIEQHPDEELPEDLLRKATRIMLMHFKDLLYLLLSTTKEGFEAIRGLFNRNNPKLKFAFQRYPEFNDLLTDIAKSKIHESDWFRIFNKVRPSPEKRGANYRDSEAIEMLLALNQKLQKRKEILLLVSDADSMDSVLNWDMKPELAREFRNSRPGIIECPGLETEIRILRTSQTFLLYLLTRGHTAKSTLENLEDKSRRMLEFGKLSPLLEDLKRECAYYPADEESLAGDESQKCQRCSRHQKCDELKKRIVSYRETIDQLDSVRLFVNRSFFLRPHKQIVDKALDEKLLSIIKGFLGLMKGRRSEAFASEFVQEEAELHRTIFSTGLALRRLSEGVVRESLDQHRRYEPKFRGFPDTIRFRDPQINETLERYVSVSRKVPQVPTEIHDLSLEMLALTDRDDEYHESRLLLAALFYCYGEYMYSNYIIEKEIEKTALPNELEYRYLQCLCLSRQGLEPGNVRFFHRAVATADQLLKKHPTKPRAYYLRGVLLARGFQSGILASDKIGEAIHLFEKADGCCDEGDQKLKVKILNNIVFTIYLSEKYTEENVAKATDAFGCITEHIDTSRWSPHWWDTSGCLKFMQSFVTTGLQQQLKLLNEAKEDVERAIQHAEATGFPDKDRNWMGQNLEKVMDRLHTLENPSEG